MTEITPNPDRSPLSRRKFLGMAGSAAAASVTMTAMPFGFAPPAGAQDDDYRSLVCVFFSGGADSFNMYVPLDHNVAGQDYATYAKTRGRFAVAPANLTPIGDGSFGLNQRLNRLADIYNSGRMAVVRNVGVLERPTVKADFLAGRYVPQSLFAHDAQRKLWQTGRSTLASDQGWGGSITAGVAAGATVPPMFSLDGTNVWESSVSAPYSRISPNIAIQRLAGYDPALWRWFPQLQNVAPVLAAAQADAAASTSLLDQAAARTIQSSITTTDALLEATADTDANNVFMDDIGRSSLGLQLEQVARLIKNREALGMARQVFFVQIDGFDTHGSQAELEPLLLDEVNLGLGSFQNALDIMEVADTVTTFTASDFGRTLTSNGDGTDHGWGGNAFVMGGAVNGGDYGTFPNLTTENNPDDIGGANDRGFAGRLIPTTSVAQYAATVSRWMGLTGGPLSLALPQLGNFPVTDLGFMRP